MRGPAIPSVHQLLALLAVTEEGSLTGAAKRLGRATSAISYAIDTLERDLGLSLFDRGTTRKPKLTQQGEAIVAEARAVAYSIETLRARVRGFLEELEPEVSLVVDSMLPSDRLTTLLREFNAQFPTVPVRLLVQTLGGVERAVRNGHARIGVGSELHMDITGFRRFDIKGVQLIPVAAPSHPLAKAGEAAPPPARDFLQLVLSEQLGAESRDYGVVSLHTWRIGDLSARHKLLSRWTRVERNAGTYRSRRYRIGKARAIEPSRLAGRRICPAGRTHDGYPAGSGRALADRAAGDPV
jgi:DNA-binding transcriptional LysR family regulator